MDGWVGSEEVGALSTHGRHASHQAGQSFSCHEYGSEFSDLPVHYAMPCRPSYAYIQVQRLNVENMGCQGGFRCLAMVQDIAQGRSRNVVLVVVCDLRNSMGNQMVFHDDYTPIDKSTVVSSSLFRDAGGAAIVAHPHYKQGLLLRQRQQQRQAAALGLPLPELPLPLGLEIVDSRMELIPNTEGLAVMKERNGGVLHLYLDKDLPHAAHRALPSVIKSLLADSSYPDLTPADCCYALHTGVSQHSTRTPPYE